MTLTVKELSSKMSDIDFCMLSTKNQGSLASRPMSNNGDVEYDGDFWFFSYEDSGKVRQIEHDSNVSLTFTAGKGLLGSPGIFISIEGEAELVRDRNAFAEHWTRDLEMWFPDGIDTPGIVLIKAHANSIKYWDGEEQGEIAV